MKTVLLSVQTPSAVADRAKLAMKGVPQGAHISFSNLELLWKVLAPNRMAVLQTMAGCGPLALREVARRLERDVKAVHTDVQLLLKVGILEKTENGQLLFDYDAVHVDFMLQAA